MKTVAYAQALAMQMVEQPSPKKPAAKAKADGK